MSDPFSTDLNLSENEVDKLLKENNALRDDLERVRAELRECGDSFSEVEQAAMRFQARLDRAVEALREAQSKQPERVAWFRSEGVVFDKAPGGDDYWQRIAFIIYTDLCEVESITRAALAEIEESVSETLGPRNIDPDAYDNYEEAT